MDYFAIPQLNGELLTLEPLTLDHAPELAEAIAGDDLYKARYTRLPSPDHMAADIESKLARHDGPAVRAVSDSSEQRRQGDWCDYVSEHSGRQQAA